MGQMISRKQREFTDVDIKIIGNTVNNWRNSSEQYQDTLGFCKSASISEVAAHRYSLSPGGYVGSEEIEDDEESFSERMIYLTERLSNLSNEGNRLDAVIKENLKVLGYEL